MYKINIMFEKRSQFSCFIISGPVRYFAVVLQFQSSPWHIL